MRNERMHFVEYFTPASRLKADKYADKLLRRFDPREPIRLNRLRNEYLRAMGKKHPPFSPEEALDYLRKWNEPTHKSKSRQA